MPINAKTIRYLCVKKRDRKPKDPLTVDVMGKLSELMMGKTILAKCDDPGNATITMNIGNTQILNVLIYLGIDINVMTIEIVQKLWLTNLRPTPAIIKLADRSTIKPEGILGDLVVLVDSWKYPTDFLVLHPNS